MFDQTIVTFDSKTTDGWIWIRLVAARRRVFDTHMSRPVLAVLHSVCFGLGVVFALLSVLLLVDELSAVERFVLLGLLTGQVLTLSRAWMDASTRGGAESTTGSRTLSKDVTFSVLKNRRRREVLRYLRRADGTASLRELTEHIAAKENDVEPDELTSAQRKRVYTTLYQCHLPMMDDGGVIEYTQKRGSVELLDPASELFAYIDDTSGANPERRWGLVSMGLTIAVSSVIISRLLIVQPMGDAVIWSWVVLISSSLLVLALAKSC